MWMLVFINIMLVADDTRDKEPFIEAWYNYNNLNECFIARDKLLASLGSTNGFPPLGTQAVCIRYGE